LSSCIGGDAHRAVYPERPSPALVVELIPNPAPGENNDADRAEAKYGAEACLLRCWMICASPGDDGSVTPSVAPMLEARPLFSSSTLLDMFGGSIEGSLFFPGELEESRLKVLSGLVVRLLFRLEKDCGEEDPGSRAEGLRVGERVRLAKVATWEDEREC
jgi:hypothetical protein